MELLFVADDAGGTHIGQLILVAKELPTIGKAATDLPCSTGAAPSAAGQASLQAFCDVAGGPPGIEISYDSEYLGKNDGESRWSITVRIVGLPQSGTIQRHVQAMIDSELYWLSVNYNTPAAKTQSLQIIAPGKNWLIRETDSRIGLQVLSKGAEQSTLELVNSTLQDHETNERINVNVFQLCVMTVCGRQISISGEETLVVDLRADGGAVPYGTFTGNLTFVADGIALSNAIELTVLSTGFDIQFIGVLLIAAGVLVAWVITVFLPHQSQRLEELRPAIVIRESVDVWRSKLVAADKLTGATSAMTIAQLNEIGSSLSDKELQTRGYVSGRIPPPGSATHKPVETYSIYLKKYSDSLSATAHIIANGIEEIAADWGRYEADKKVSEATDALGKLDKLSKLATPNTVDGQISAILVKLLKDSSVTRSSQTGRTTITQVTSEQLTSQLETLNTGAWTVWIFITVASGWAALILTNSGFGSTQDLFSCFGWGLGLQAIGPKLSTLNTATVSKQVKFNIPG